MHSNLPRLAGFLAAMVFCLPLAAQEISILGLAKPISVGGNRIVIVSGPSADMMLDVAPRLDPPDPNIFLIPQKGDEKQKLWPFLVVVMDEAEPGKRSFVIARNSWLKPLGQAAELAKTGLANEADAKVLITLAADYAKRYPFLESSAVLEVGGARPPPVDPDNPIPPDTPSPTRVSRVTYCYEKDQNNPPRPVSLALQKLNTESGGLVVASEFEEDTVNAAGQTPVQYRTALAAAQKAGLPALVVQMGDVVLRVVKNPATEKDVLDASK